ncbi:MAG: GNAT family N-acetyltransferase [Chloroflexota bacterium]
MPDPAYRIRTYEPRDYDDVLRLHFEGVRQTRIEAPDVPGYNDADLLDIEAKYLSDGSHFWVVESPDDGAVGITAIERMNESTGRLRRMRVTSSWRRRGVARALLDTAAEFCRQNGYNRLILDTTSEQTAAHVLYERYGFVRTGERMIGPFRVFDYEMSLA